MKTYEEVKRDALEALREDMSLSTIYDEARDRGNKDVVLTINKWFDERCAEVKKALINNIRENINERIVSDDLNYWVDRLEKYEMCEADKDFESLETLANEEINE